MAERAEERSEPDHAVAAYKRLLKAYLDRRPSGTRQKVAEALGTHKSFVSQITNPNYRVPLPAQHVGTIAKICHLSPEEMREFLAAYREAHPSQAPAAREDRATGVGSTGRRWPAGAGRSQRAPALTPAITSSTLLESMTPGPVRISRVGIVTP